MSSCALRHWCSATPVSKGLIHRMDSARGDVRNAESQAAARSRSSRIYGTRPPGDRPILLLFGFLTSANDYVAQLADIYAMIVSDNRQRHITPDATKELKLDGYRTIAVKGTENGNAVFPPRSDSARRGGDSRSQDFTTIHNRNLRLSRKCSWIGAGRRSRRNSLGITRVAQDSHH
jgi:hypothetical protein